MLGSSKPQRGKPSRSRQKAKEEELRWQWPLARDLRETLGGEKADPKVMLKEVYNPALLIQRFVAYPGLKNIEWGWQVGPKTLKSQAWKAVEERLQELYRSSSDSSLKNYLKALKERNDIVKNALQGQSYEILSFLAQVVWRLVIGLGLPSPFEVGITLHYLYGFPYLPGSAIKGVTRNWRLQQIADKLGIPRLSAQHIHQWKNEKHYGLTPWERLEQLLVSPLPEVSDDEERKRRLRENLGERYRQLQQALQGKCLEFLKEKGYFLDSNPKLLEQRDLEAQHIRCFSRAFGSTEAKGEILFFDAYPESLTTADDKPILELDVMNPHYGKYYQGDEPPADWLSPVPVFFLAVRQGTLFTIQLACRDQKLLDTVEGWVKTALQEFGIGAKTRAGYGELQGATATIAPGQPSSVAAATTIDPVAQLEAAVSRWTEKRMGDLQQLVEQISRVADAAQRLKLAQQLQQKLQQAGRWGRKYQDKTWYQALQQVLGGEDGQS